MWCGFITDITEWRSSPVTDKNQKVNHLLENCLPKVAESVIGVDRVASKAYIQYWR